MKLIENPLKFLCLAALLAAANPILLAQDNKPAVASSQTETAIFAGGCFWCMEPPYDKLNGVLSTHSGYTGGHVPNPNYEEVSAGGTGHYEAVRITYDPSKVSYAALLDVFWPNIDPLDGGGQFCDRGNQYLSAIFYQDEEQKRLAEASKRAIAASGQLDGEIQTQILPAAEFYVAEEYHQDYYQKNPVHYHFYRFGCRRNARLEDVWGSD